MYATDYTYYTTIHNARCIASLHCGCYRQEVGSSWRAVHNRAAAAAAGAFSKTSFKHR